MRGALLALCWVLAPACASAATGPSFNCARAGNDVERTICADPGLAAQDRDLAEIFNNTRSQGGIDAKALRRAQDVWLSNIRNRCADRACISRAYRDRRAALLDQGLQAASPAAYAETRPFPAPPALWAKVQALIGQSCTEPAGPIAPPPGFHELPKFLPLIANGHLVQAFEKDGVRFAFLYAARPNMDPSCRIIDAVVLPPSSQADQYLQCSVESLGAYGLGMRAQGHTELRAFWAVADNATLQRTALDVLGSQDGVHCQAPEAGE